LLCLLEEDALLVLLGLEHGLHIAHILLLQLKGFKFSLDAVVLHPQYLVLLRAFLLTIEMLHFLYKFLDF
jgi:hypothetical protein